MQRLASVLLSADVSANAEQPLIIDAEKAADVRAESIGVELCREFALWLRDEQIADDCKTRGLGVPRARCATLSLSRKWNH
jgi:hypothetical protein